MSVENVRTFFGTPEKSPAKKTPRDKVKETYAEVDQAIAEKRLKLAKESEEKEWQKTLDAANKKIALANNEEGIEPVDSRDLNEEGIEGVE